MESREPAAAMLDDVLTEIAHILGEGYRRYRSRRCLPPAKDIQHYEKIAEKPLDSSLDIVLHTESTRYGEKDD